ncbi:MAG: hypothetical protein NTZ33_06395 [Bacteroidetes bacterium]|nr:hypothetical protein [Bacteroidota bacterium]
MNTKDKKNEVIHTIGKAKISDELVELIEYWQQENCRPLLIDVKNLCGAMVTIGSRVDEFPENEQPEIIEALKSISTIVRNLKCVGEIVVSFFLLFNIEKLLGYAEYMNLGEIL